MSPLKVCATSALYSLAPGPSSAYTSSSQLLIWKVAVAVVMGGLLVDG